MRLRQIEVFHAVYSTGTMTGAAAMLNVSQPSVSKVLAHAEQQLGYLLFDRIKGKLVPTPEAHRLFAHVATVYRDVDRLRHVAASLKGKPLKTFNFKTLGSLAALGHQLAVAEIMGYRFSGFLAWLMWRGIYLSKLPGLDKQVRVGLDWILDVFFPPDIVQTIDFSRPSAVQRLQAHQAGTDSDRYEEQQVLRG